MTTTDLPEPPTEPVPLTITRDRRGEVTTLRGEGEVTLERLRAGTVSLRVGGVTVLIEGTLLTVTLMDGGRR
jgi:hypothetical protein